MKHLVDKIIERIPDLNHDERVRVKSALTNLEDYKRVCDIIESKLDENPECPHCGATRIHKHGIVSGLMRYKCTHCKKTFNALTNTPLAHLRKKELWLSNISEMLESKVIRKVAAELNVNTKTAFRWRHRFSSWFYKDKSPPLSGIVEADETYFQISRKGDRNLQRPPRKHGGDNSKRCLSKDHVCVFTARDRSGHNFECITGRGPVKGKWLDLFLSGKITQDAVLVTDGYKSYEHFCQAAHIMHVVVFNKKNKRVKGPYHIQHVNAFHERIKNWINGHFRGVATKYLNHYLWWKHELENKHITNSEALFRAAIGTIP